MTTLESAFNAAANAVAPSGGNGEQSPSRLQ
jgi:hypothetical protein